MKWEEERRGVGQDGNLLVLLSLRRPRRGLQVRVCLPDPSPGEEGGRRGGGGREMTEEYMEE